MILDAFCFFNELEVLSLRLAVLGGIVDRFILVEATKTFSGLDKPLYYALHKAKFGQWQERISHVIVREMPIGDNHWQREAYQRNACARVLEPLSLGHRILIGDVDEIPRPERMPRDLELRCFNQQLYYYDAYCSAPGGWLGTCTTTVGDVLRMGAEGVRRRRDTCPVIERGGWHFSHTGGVEVIHQKLLAGSHQEYNTPEHHHMVEQRVAEGKDLFGRDELNFRRIETLAETLPSCLLKEPHRWPGLTGGI